MTSGPAKEAQRLAEQSAQALYERDRASQALGMRLAAVGPGWARVVMTVRADMVNGHRVCHGGLVFALADSISVLVYGRVIAAGAPSDIRRNEEVKRAYLGDQHVVVRHG